MGDCFHQKDSRFPSYLYAGGQSSIRLSLIATGSLHEESWPEREGSGSGKSMRINVRSHLIPDKQQELGTVRSFWIQIVVAMQKR